MTTLEQTFQDEIEVERLWLATTQGGYAFFTMIPITLLLLIGLWDTASHNILLLWSALLTTADFFRWRNLRFYQLHKDALVANINKFKRLMVLGSLFSGVFRGGYVVLFLVPSRPDILLIIFVPMVIETVGAMLSWYFYLPAVIVILLPQAIPLLIVLVSEGGKIYYATALIVACVAVYCITSSIKLAKALNHALLLSFQNAALSKDYEEKSMLLETALENMGQGIVMSGKDDRLRLWNRQFINILDAAGEKVTIDSGLADILSGANPPVVINPDGQAVYRLENDKAYEVRQSELKQGGRVITFTDITALMKRERSLKNARKEAIEANCAKIRFLATASHDLRQPIHALGLFFAQLSDRVRSPDTSQLISQVEDSIEAINTMLNALLDVSKLDAGIVKPSAETFSLAELFERLSLEFRQLALENGNELKFRPVTAHVHTDPAMLERMLRNLIGNAIRYTKNGRILVAARCRGESLEIKILDTGVGIPEDKFEEIFVEFHQLHNPARDRRQGLGLGLAIVKRLANLLCHEIKVSSKLGRGSCFTITLPLAPKNMSALIRLKNETTPGSNYSLGGYRLLILDDDIAVRESMEGLLSRWGCKVLTAGSQAEAAGKLANGMLRIDLLVVDYRLSGEISGIEAARNLQRSLNYPVDVLIITGDTGPERLQEAETSGFPLLHKPVQPAKLRSTLHYLISKGNAVES